MILTRRFFALSAASAVVAGGALLPATAFAAAPVADDTATYSTLLYTDDMSQDGSGGRIRTDHADPGRGDRDGDGRGGEWRTHPVCFAAPCEL
ncbi:hypothetical protein ACIF70_28310 [Actinacidiphila glaucinigra]|uniref:hypothetical protein n=1 Tax=Actinacidiphila glaucinigra TaxID=235986 RepID=UPI0037C63C59